MGSLLNRSLLFLSYFALCLPLLLLSGAHAEVPTPSAKPHTPVEFVVKAPVVEAQAPAPSPHPIRIPSKPSKSSTLSLFRNVFPAIKKKDKTSERIGKGLQLSITRYRKIFNLQNEANFKAADKEISKLKNKSLMGHVLLHRYMHPTGYQASFEELANWLKKYGDHPSAKRIYKLAERRMPNGYGYALPAPYQPTYMNGSLGRPNNAKTFTPLAYQRTEDEERTFKALISSIQHHISEGFPTGALRALQEANIQNVMSQSEKDTLLSKISLSYLVEGKPDDAFQQASIVADRNGEELPLSGWVAGIAAWQQQRYSVAGQYFQKTASSAYTNAWTVSAASYWAARSYSRIKNKDKEDFWLREAALYPRTFYGVLANKRLGVTEEFDWRIPAFTNDHRRILFSHPRGERAYLLANIGFENLANLELEAIDPRDNGALKTALFSMAQQYQLSRFLFKFGNSFKRSNGGLYDAALYPKLSSWDMAQPHKVDKALIHALVRQESRFKADAQSSGGALGLMQVLPSTAAYITGNKKLTTTQKSKLLDQNTNVEIGESYVYSLLNKSDVSNNLFYLLIGYNAGPATLSRWKEKTSIVGDPLLFIELIPSAETRAFVERVMTNLWIYRDQFGQESPSLEAIIRDIRPPYRALDRIN